MYAYFNEAGEPLMDGAAMRYEQYLDSTYEPDPDDFYNSWDDYDDDYANPDTCSHGDGSYPDGAGYECDLCGETFLGPRPAAEVAGGVEWETFWTRVW